MQPGAIVLVKYENKFSKDRFRLARVFDVRKDSDGIVRTAWVGLRSLRRAVREPLDVCRAGLSFTELPVQRLVLILPPGDQPPEILEGMGNFPPMPGKGQARGQEEALEAPEEAARVQPGVREPVRVQVEPPAAEIRDLPLPQRQPRGRPRRN